MINTELEVYKVICKMETSLWSMCQRGLKSAVHCLETPGRVFFPFAIWVILLETGLAVDMHTQGQLFAVRAVVI